MTSSTQDQDGLPSSPPERHVPAPGANALALMLAGLAMLGPFSIDTYLPAFPAIQASLDAADRFPMRLFR